MCTRSEMIPAVATPGEWARDKGQAWCLCHGIRQLLSTLASLTKMPLDRKVQLLIQQKQPSERRLMSGNVSMSKWLT